MFLVDETRDAHNQHTALRDLVARLQPADIPLREAPVLYRELAGMARLIGGAMTLMAGRVAESEVWKREGFPSPAEWFAKTNGTSAQPARVALATSKRLRTLPHTETALRRGDLSGMQANLIADAASRDPQAETDLLSLAGKASLMELRQECLRRKAASDPDPNKTAERLHAERHVRTHTDAEGAWNLHARGPVVSGSRIGQAVNLITDKLFRHARTEDHTETPRDAHAYDALQTLADCFWDVYHGHQPTWTWNATTPPAGNPDGPVRADADTAGVSGEHDGNDTGEAGAVNRQDGKPSRPGNDNPPSSGERTDTASSRSGSDPTRVEGDASDDLTSRPGGDRTRADDDASGDDSGVGVNRDQRRRQGVSSVKRPALKDLTVVHADLSGLLRGHLFDGERCEMPGLGPVTVDDVRRLLPGSVLKLIVTDGAGPVNVTHLGSGVGWMELAPGAQRPRGRAAPVAPRHLVLAGLDAAVLCGDPSPGGVRGALGVGPIDPGAVGGVVAGWVLDRIAGAGVDVAGQVHHGRGLNTAQWAASLWAQPLCSVQGCNRLRVEYDHRHPWADDRQTALGNIDPLCSHHHRLKTHEGWALVDGTGPRPMVPPTHPRHPDKRSSGERVGAAA